MELGVLIATMLATAVLTMVGLKALRPIALRIGLVDMPGGRKRHDGEIPLIGGVAMFLGIFLGGTLLAPALQAYLAAFAACSILVAIGVLDDRFALSAGIRIAGQTVAVLIMVYGRNYALADIGDPFGTGVITMGRFTLVFTLLVTLTMINAFNMVDGLDGLAGSLSLIAFLSIAAVAGLTSYSGAVALMIASAIAGFLVFNFPFSWNRHRRTFMGDAGSTLLGFAIVWTTLGIAQGDARVISPVHCLWFAALPIYDLMSVFFRRITRRKSPIEPGRDHFHHVLRRGGFSVRHTVLILAGLQALYAVIGVSGHFAGVPDYVMFVTWSIVGISQRRVIREIARRNRRGRVAAV